MPQLEPNLWIEGGYYIDFDQLDQFRILGPNNHLYCGFIDAPRHRLAIDKLETTPEQKLVVTGRFLKSTFNLYNPVMGDMRTMRGLVVEEQTNKLVTFLELRKRETSQSVPMWIHRSQGRDGKALLFRRSYGDKWYGTTFHFPTWVNITAIQRPFGGFKLEARGKKHIPFTITADTNDLTERTYRSSVMPDEAIEWKTFGKEAAVIKKFWQRSKIEADHLITWGKTSGDRFGTVFPRDWMESVLLGAGDIPSETIDAMIIQCLANVDGRGRMWHEDVVGEYRYRHQLSGRDLFDRKMIDIEPLVILALRYTSANFWTNTDALTKLRRMAKYVVANAHKKHWIAFKRKPKSHQTADEQYYLVGNWRDSTWAFKKVHPHLAPFDVNAVLYPEALRELQLLSSKLQLTNAAALATLRKRWDKQSEHFAITNPDTLPAYALAVYGMNSNVYSAGRKVKFQQYKVNHLDECYRYALSEGTETELASYCKRLADKKYFWTASGPLLVAANNSMGYTSQEYHGLVIWTKQVAFALLGLTRHLEQAKSRTWSLSTQKLLRATALDICRRMVSTFAKLNAIPELHFDDRNTPRLFTDQQATGEHMSKVQLWSAIGARRIFREYYKLLKQK
ncbi:MAG: hypothetical protein AAB515_02225 [Patescibacteria group bacterium]